MQPAEEMVRAIVAGRTEVGEADFVVRLLSPAGIFTAFAHGARRSRRRFAGALESFASIDAEVRTPRRGRDALPTLASAVVVSARFGIRQDLTRIALAAYATELAGRVAPGGEGAVDVFALTTLVLDRLSERAPRLADRRAFELHLLNAIGCRPQVDGCAACGALEHTMYLDFEAGGLRCGLHRGRATPLAARAARWMRTVLAEGVGAAFLGATDELSDDANADGAASELGPSLDRYFAGLLPRPIRSRGLLGDCGLA